MTQHQATSLTFTFRIAWQGGEAEAGDVKHCVAPGHPLHSAFMRCHEIGEMEAPVTSDHSEWLDHLRQIADDVAREASAAQRRGADVCLWTDQWSSILSLPELLLVAGSPGFHLEDLRASVGAMATGGRMREVVGVPQGPVGDLLGTDAYWGWAPRRQDYLILTTDALPEEITRPSIRRKLSKDLVRFLTPIMESLQSTDGGPLPEIVFGTSVWRDKLLAGELPLEGRCVTVVAHAAIDIAAPHDRDPYLLAPSEDRRDSEIVDGEDVLRAIFGTSTPGAHAPNTQVEVAACFSNRLFHRFFRDRPGERPLVRGVGRFMGTFGRYSGLAEYLRPDRIRAVLGRSDFTLLGNPHVPFLTGRMLASAALRAETLAELYGEAHDEGVAPHDRIF